MTPPLGQIVRHTLLLPEAERIPAVVEQSRALAADAFALVERALAGRSWLLPEFGAADVMMGYSVKLASVLRLLGEAHPNLTAYLARCEERPAFRRAAA
jgi:glutathione S-transferase